MQTYVVLVNWTEKGIANVRDAEKRVVHGFEEEKKFGVKIRENYWTMGGLPAQSGVTGKITGSPGNSAAAAAARAVRRQLSTARATMRPGG